LLGVEPTRPNPPGFYTSSKLIRGEAIGSIQNRDGLGRSAAKELIKADLGECRTVKSRPVLIPDTAALEFKGLVVR
jgi:hypothetical protein